MRIDLHFSHPRARGAAGSEVRSGVCGPDASACFWLSINYTQGVNGWIAWIVGIEYPGAAAIHVTKRSTKYLRRGHADAPSVGLSRAHFMDSLGIPGGNLPLPPWQGPHDLF